MKTTKYTDTYGAVGMCLGVAFGCWTDQLAVGIMFGLAIGICVGNRKDKKINQQLTSDGWEVIAIHDHITIQNKAKRTKEVNYIPDVKIGDTVYLQENNTIEKI